MDRINISALDDLIAIYFGQDDDLFDDSEDIEPKIDAFIAGSHKGLQHAVIDDIDLFLKECDELESDFRKHYRDTFVPENWGTTPGAFLDRVKARIQLALQGYARNPEC
ncbi:contact-dependent growth inhibition system immunity protein [Erwiniaceae bacterium L1_54_3]|nr:contact-dependent growth inhibition system immunity protein [Erwiniaceae bacterium L1_54_3]